MGTGWDLGVGEKTRDPNMSLSQTQKSEGLQRIRTFRGTDPARKCTWSTGPNTVKTLLAGGHDDHCPTSLASLLLGNLQGIRER